MVIAEILLAASGSIILALGSAHLVFTFWGAKLTPRDPNLQAAMKAVSPVITRDTTMWKAWIGFNASHSLGAMFIGQSFVYLAFAQASLFFGSAYLQIVGLAFLIAYLVLGWRYWFKIPFSGISLSLVLYVASISVAHG
jgi:hypothetical protein